MNRQDVILQLLMNEKSPVVGTTRMQKLAFLIEKESGIKLDEDFAFEPYKFGPFSAKLRNDVEFLVNLGYLEKKGDDGEPRQSISLDNLENCDADDFLSDTDKDSEGDASLSGSTSEGLANKKQLEAAVAERQSEEDTVIYRLTPKGVEYLKNNKDSFSVAEADIKKIREKYGKKSLTELLRHVYLKYPEYATESEIKDKFK